ncbi:bifunctional phosphopantothenoylcysteine decarboxylase/phosphopantothenate--cysteine ligase CoaBC [Hypnocyclicus thermotrophus]|nr:bifunctional phosphopantothenoylcysteine decarboxylase/phosphopantothenate--cysteine ligase CoaBC [Hypnocyclicus thermotrophus]
MKNILIGVTGGISAYKSANIISKLKKKGYNIKVIMTKNATEIITPLTLETLARDRVVIDMWEKKSNYDVEHISLAEWADLILVAPATYNIIGKIANGIADDMLSTVISAAKAPIYFAIAMNVNMYENPILHENISKLKNYGYNFIDSDEGFLACNTTGKGRLRNEDEIIKIVETHFNYKILSGKKILITAGRTEEKIDPIRYLSNKSSGKMGYSIAKYAKELGAEVILIAGPNSQEDIKGITTIKVNTALQMYEKVFEYYSNVDTVFAVAAVADYRAKDISKNKIKKNDENLVIELVRNPDILFEMGKQKENQLLIGFCAESENLIENAYKKLEKKNLDYIIANHTTYFSSNKNKVVLIDKNKNNIEFDEANKEEIAKKLLNKIFNI